MGNQINGMDRMREKKKSSYEGRHQKRKEQITLVFPHKMFLLDLFSVPCVVCGYQHFTRSEH